ncbi:adenylylsulfate kinase [Pseudonocardia sediminis]|uniref:Adenylyl-sulfate kinase n=1 Tax=Pseudonocardia sediminis TaxID=1397368 RepID=A0A4Q7V1S5_PSEST|nr:adenylyl-sulfate kinase [Pseudonocardia sediminis]RZT87281.1 adenylylsulfate kinase [Pseudonocardia sediminis]
MSDTTMFHPAPSAPVTQRGATVWLTGLPSAGKSTIAHGCESVLRAGGLRVEVLDGDAVRPHLAAARGYSRDDRAINIRRIGWVAELLARNGVLVLVSAIAPFRDVRDEVRATHAAGGTVYQEVHVSTPVDVASERDVKGLYARQRVGEISGLTGVDDPYEIPLAPELVIPAHEQAVDESVSLLVTHLRRAGLAGPAAPEES